MHQRPPPDPPDPPTLTTRSVDDGPPVAGVEAAILRTDRGDIVCRFHDPGPGDAAVLWLGGVRGGLGSPARGIYPRLAERLALDGVASLRLAYRAPFLLSECVQDAALGLAYLEGRGRKRIAVVGHSLGGAVAITVGARSPTVVGVAALSSQTFGTDDVGDLSPRPLLLIHGKRDEILTYMCSIDLHARARDPRELVLYDDVGHDLDERRHEVDRTLISWLRNLLLFP